jgi:hypothetical protein
MSHKPPKQKKKPVEPLLPEMPALAPAPRTMGHGETVTDPRRRHAGVERRERQKHARDARRKHGAP